MVGPPLRVEYALWVFPDIYKYLLDLCLHFEGEHPTVIRRKLSDGSYSLHGIDHRGFFISSCTDNKMFIVSAYSFDLSCKLSISSIIRMVCLYAFEHGYAKLAFSSPRLAWRRIVPSLGFVRHNNVYTKELP